MSQRLWLAALLGAMVLWFLPLGSYRLLNPDEGRYAEIPREMAVSGDWITPRLDAIKYFEKPPLQYWATTVAYELFGVNEWSARLWTALTGFLGVLLTAWIGNRLYGARAGALAALVQAGSLLYLGLAHVSTLDMGLTFTLQLTLVGLLLLVERDRARLGAGMLAVGVALAFLSKGLVGILIPGAVAGLFMLIRRDWGLLWRARPWWSLLMLALLALPWLWQIAHRNPEFLQFFFVHEQFARFLTRVHLRYQPDWFFIPVLLAGFMPWTPLLPAVVVRCWRDCRQGRPAAWLLALWVGFNFAFFSLSQSKLVPYILPLFPALALLAGRCLDQLEARRVSNGLAISAALGLLPALAVVWIWQSPAMLERFDIVTGPVAPLFATGFLVATLLAGLAAWFAAWRGVLPGAVLATAASAALIGPLLLAADDLPHQKAAVDIVAAARPYLGPATAFYCVDDYQQSIPFYLGRPCTLVRYRGELDFGLQQQPHLCVADLPQFAARWRAEHDALAVIRTESYAELRRMGLSMRVIYTAPSLVAVVKE